MSDQVSIRMNIDIPTLRYLENIQLRNEEVEHQIKVGVERALAEVCDGDNFANMVKDKVKDQILNLVSKSILGYEFQKQLQQSIQEKIGAKIESYTEVISEKLTTQLNNLK